MSDEYEEHRDFIAGKIRLARDKQLYRRDMRNRIGLSKNTPFIRDGIILMTDKHLIDYNSYYDFANSSADKGPLVRNDTN